MSRRIFISFSYTDQKVARGFNLLRWNKNVDFEFVGRHLLAPVDSSNEAYISQKIREQIDGTSVTVVLIGKDTHESTWVAKEIGWSLDKPKKNGILGILLDGAEKPPRDSPVGRALYEANADIIKWEPENFSEAVEKAALAAGRAETLESGGGGGGAGGEGARGAGGGGCTPRP